MHPSVPFKFPWKPLPEMWLDQFLRSTACFCWSSTGRFLFPKSTKSVTIVRKGIRVRREPAFCLVPSSNNPYVVIAARESMVAQMLSCTHARASFTEHSRFPVKVGVTREAKYLPINSRFGWPSQFCPAGSTMAPPIVRLRSLLRPVAGCGWQRD